jgi:hypothetical protein
MWPVVHDLSVSGLQADALFASTLQRCDEPGAGQVRQAAVTAIREFGYSGCAARVAQEFGDHPEMAAIRMRWARAVTGAAFAQSALQPWPFAIAGDGRHAARPRLPADQVAGDSPGTGQRDLAVFLAGRPVP